MLLFCSNDYLGLAGDPRLTAALAEGGRRWGAGAAASRLISGDTAAHTALERELDLFGRFDSTGVVGARGAWVSGESEDLDRSRWADRS